MQTESGDINLSDVKRCYVDLKVTAICPQCQSVVTHDFTQHYLSYPELNYDGDSCAGYCEKCDRHVVWPMTLKKAKATIEHDPSKAEMD